MKTTEIVENLNRKLEFNLIPDRQEKHKGVIESGVKTDLTQFEKPLKKILQCEKFYQN